jgi:hypothetical protein
VAEVTLEFLGEQMRRMLDEQRAMRDEQRDMREQLGDVRERGELTARAIEATRQQFLAQLELAKIELLEAITVETRSESIRTRIEQQLDAMRGEIRCAGSAHRGRRSSGRGSAVDDQAYQPLSRSSGSGRSMRMASRLSSQGSIPNASRICSWPLTLTKRSRAASIVSLLVVRPLARIARRINSPLIFTFVRMPGSNLRE